MLAPDSSTTPTLAAQPDTISTTKPHEKPDDLENAAAHASAIGSNGRPTYQYNDIQKFRKAWEHDGKPALRATLDQSKSTMTLYYQDADRADHQITLDVGEASVGRFAASDIDKGEYHLGGRESAFKGGAWVDGDDGSKHSDRAVGAASIPIVQIDGENRITATLANGQLITDGADVMYHGGGSRLASPWDPHQPLVATEACVRGHNYDVAGIAQIVRENGASIPLTIR